MRAMLLSLGAVALWLVPPAASAQDGRAVLERAAGALGASAVRSIQYSGSGVHFAVGQSAVPGAPWPRFNVKSFTRAANDETAALRDEIVRTQGEDPPRGGGQQPVRGEQRQIFVVSGDHAWNVAADAAVPAPVALAERQMQLWTTPHGFVKAALAHGATVSGRVVAFNVPGRFRAQATLDAQDLIERIDVVLAHPVVGDLPVLVTYADYRDFGGVKFPARIRQAAGGFPSLDLTVHDVRANAAVDLAVPDAVRQATAPYARVTSQRVADGVFYLTGGTHHSVVIEMADHVIVVESPLTDQRALAVSAEVKTLVPGKPVRYLVNSHHHFDHAGGVRGLAGEGAIIVTHEVNRAFFEQALATPATVNPDHLARSGRQAVVEGVRPVMTPKRQ
jgi:hypothetical protein